MRTPLRGTRVVEIGTFVAAPALGNLLGMMGAEVVKVEPIVGDITRELTPWSWVNYNWNKRSLCLNLKDEAGREIIRRLVSRSDVFIENLSPRAVEELQIGYRSLRRFNPRLIYCSIKGFAADSPSGTRLAFDTIAQAEGGLMYVARREGEPPNRIGNPCVDLTAATYAAVGVLATMLGRPRRGAYIEIPLYDLVVYWNGYWFPFLDIKKEEPRDLGGSHPGFSPYGVYKTNDGFVFIGVLTDEQWGRLTEKLGLEVAARLSRTEGRVRYRTEVNEAVERRTSSLGAEELLKMLGEEVPCARISSISGLHANRDLRERGVVTQVKSNGRPLTIALPPIHGLMGHVEVGDPPEAGADTEEVLLRLGISRREIEKLRKRRIAR